MQQPGAFSAIFLLVFVWVLSADAQSRVPQTSVQPHVSDGYEQHNQAAIRINELARQIHSESDASTLVSEIAALFADELPPAWAVSGIEQRVAHAEYQSVHTPAKLISEKRIVDVWNRYVREIGAPDETLLTTAEIHNLRDAKFTAAQLMWVRGMQTIWTMPNIYAVGTDGKVADGCRALEAIEMIHDLDELFPNLRVARDRVRRGIVPSEEAKKLADSSPPQRGARLELRADADGIRPAERRYVQEHGSEAYSQLLQRLFDELFPTD